MNYLQRKSWTNYSPQKSAAAWPRRVQAVPVRQWEYEMNSQPPDDGGFSREIADARQTVLAFSTFRDVGGVIPRSGYIQQPGVAAQRRTPGKRLINRLYAEGVPQFCTRSFTPTRIAHRIRHRIFAASAVTHPETSRFGDVHPDSECRSSKRRRVTDSQRTLHNLAAIEIRRSSVSTTSKIHVSALAPDRRWIKSLQFTQIRPQR